MRSSKILYSILFGLFVYNVSYANESKEFCKQNIDSHTFVQSTFSLGGDCIPSDPCSSSDPEIRINYCIKSVDDIDIEWYGTYARAYEIDEKRCALFNTLETNGYLQISDCTDAGLKPGEWLVRFPYGTVKGESKCSGLNGLEYGNYPGITQSEYGWSDKKIWTTDEKMLDTNPDDKGFCWCKANGLYTLMTDKTPFSSFKNNVWVYRDKPGANNCEWTCASNCAGSIIGAGKHRSTMFFGKDVHLTERNENSAQKLCYENIDDYVYIAETNNCVPVDTCSSSDKNILDKYCINNINDIDINIDATHTRAYKKTPTSYNKTLFKRECNVTGYHVGGSWPFTDCENVGLKPNDWMARFPYGTVKGESKCSAFVGGNNVDEDYHTSSTKISTTDENILDTTQGEKRYCWCKANGLYAFMTDTNPKISFNTSKWTLGYVYRQGSGHCDFCAEQCAQQLKLNPHMRRTIFFE